MPNIEWTSALICPANPKKQQFFGECEEFHQFLSVNILGGKQTNVLIFWSSLSTGAGTVVIFMFRGHVSACLKVSWSSCRCLERMPPIFRWNMRHVPENVWGFHTQKKTSHDSHGNFKSWSCFSRNWTPNGCRPKFEVGRANTYDFTHDVGGGTNLQSKNHQYCSDYTSANLTVRPSKMVVGKRLSFWEGLCSGAMLLLRIVTHQVRWTNNDKVWW